eukprot:CAMPEP_0174853488 /NCGR_PEP_ID=MMETSP1114-20130205/28688_1 /TAXON_ID=312471 /ORGANISM="Neobodo designis, Strain CCAP 1951/1" /LENGTH=352 /DNA_ID=CAMNT_0016088143 /DNA_START=43 /DNA_END=1098 /DNA_ORIENTATION=+
MSGSVYDPLEPEDSKAEKLEHSYKLLHTTWFLTAYSKCEAKSKEQRAAATRAIAYRSSITRDVFWDDNPVSSIAGAIYSEEPSEEQYDALRDLIEEFKNYVESEAAVCPALFPGGARGDLYDGAYHRLGLHARFWSMNLDLYRGAAVLQPTGTVSATNLTVEGFADMLTNSDRLSDIQAFADDAELMEQLFPTPLPFDLRSVPNTLLGYRTHPLFLHEVFWISHDTSANMRMKSVVIGLARGFGLEDNGAQLVAFKPHPDPEIREAAWNWMTKSTVFVPTLSRITATLNSLNRKRLKMTLLLALLQFPGFANFFADDFERDIFPHVKEPEKMELEDAIAAASEPEPSTSKDW